MNPPTDKLEDATREEIDQQLIEAGWVVQDSKKINLVESLGVAVREDQTSTGPADYALYIDAKLCGVLEAKREGTNLGGVAEQSARYATSEFKFAQRWVPEDQPLPFLYEATNNEIRFRDERDPKPRSRNLFHFHKPETLHNWLQQEDTLRERLQHLPELITENLWDCQIKAITGIEKSLIDGKPRALLQMATGAGKSFTYDELIARDKTNLDIFWLKDDSLEDTENLPAPEVLAQEIVEQLEAALEEFRSVEDALATEKKDNG